MAAVKQWRYSSAVLATFVVALGNISFFLGVALAQERVSDECSIQNIEKYVAWIKTAYSSELVDKFRKCSAVAVPWLIEQTKVNNADTQVTAVSLLAMIGTPASSATPRLLELLQRSQNQTLRIVSISALQKVASSENINFIIAFLVTSLNDNNPDVRLASSLALVELYKNQNKLYISSDAASYLRLIISKDIVFIFLEYMSPNIDRTFPRSTTYISSPQSYVVPTSQVSTDIDFLQNNNEYIQREIIDTLRGISKDVVPTLIGFLQDKNKSVRVAASNIIGKIGKDANDAVPVLISNFKDRDQVVRASAAKALGAIGKEDKDIIPILISALQSKDGYVRNAAAEALGTIGKDAMPALISALQSKDRYIRAATTKALGIVGKDALPILIITLQEDNDISVRFAAAKAIGIIGKDAKNAIPALVVALQNKDIRAAAAEALGKIGKDAIPVLISSLKSKDISVRFAAAEAIRIVGKDAKDAIPALIAALQDKDIRVAVAEALGKIGKDTIPALIASLKSKDIPVRVAAAKALGTVGKDAKDAIPALETALQDKDKEVRSAAIEALRAISINMPSYAQALAANTYRDLPTTSINMPSYAQAPAANTYRDIPIVQAVNTNAVVNEAQNLVERNPPQACQNFILRFLISWKCPRT
jgi:HEAT repeat protein